MHNSSGFNPDIQAECLLGYSKISQLEKMNKEF
jgi:hypothetical protein